MQSWQDTKEGKAFILTNQVLLKRCKAFSNFKFALTKSREIILTGIMKNEHFRNDYEVAIRFSPQFPAVQPAGTIFIIRPELENPPHRYTDGAICFTDDPSILIPGKSTCLTYLMLVKSWLTRYEIFLRTGKFPEHRNLRDYLKEI